MAKERFREKILEFKVTEKKKKAEALNESAQVGDKVIYNGQRGYVIGQSRDGDLLVQIQGSSDFVKPSAVKVVGMKAKVMEPPIKFDEKTQKVLFEQFVRCGIYMGNTPIKTNNCYVKYSQWRDAAMNESVNVLSNGELNIMPKENVRVYEDPNQFANPEDYIEGVIVDGATGEVVENILINAVDYTNAIGDAEGVKVIRNPESPEPRLEVLPKSLLRTLSV
jgi:hypothetical protein